MRDFTCPFCNKTISYNDVTDKDVRAAENRDNDKASWLKMPAYKRELFMTGICYECQSKTFHTSTPGFDLGEEVGECDTCGATIYKSDVENGYCGSCHAPIKD